MMTSNDGRRLLTLVPLLAAASLAAAAPPRKVSLAATSPQARAAAPRDGRLLRLAAAVFDPLTESPDFASEGLPEKPDAPDYGVVQFLPGRLDEKERLAKLGVRFFGYLPENAFQVHLTPRAVALLKESPAVRWVGTWNPGFKVHPRLRPGSRQASAEITVQLFPGVPLADVANSILARIPSASQTLAREDPVAARLRFDVPASAARAFIRETSAIPGVAWLEPYEPRHILNNGSIGPVQSNQESSISGGACTTCTLFLHGLTGTGQIVAVADSGCDTESCFFRKSGAASDVTDAENTVPPASGSLLPEKKVIAYWIQPGATAYDNDASCGGGGSNQYHGTHTSGTAVGDDYHTPSTPSFPGIDPGDGMAPNAQLLFQDIGNDSTGCLDVTDDYALYLQANSGGARIHSNSTGNDTLGEYTTIDQDADRFLFDHEEMAIFFAAGNSGPGLTTTGSPANAKNGISVGAVAHGSSTTLDGFSSRGPTADGRIKPDLVAEGQAIVSAQGFSTHVSEICLTKRLSGTSMSCPTAAGASALLREYFADGFYPTGSRSSADRLEPLAPLVKAVLLNGTLPLGSSPGFGNSGYGWGRVFLDNNLYFDGDARKLRVWSLANPDGLKTGESHRYTVTVGAGQELRVTLAWSDVEGTLGAAQTLVNDLDLTVTSGTTTWRGNALSNSGDSTPGGEADRVNTVEQVKLTAPSAGTYVLTVTGASIPGGGRSDTDRQGYALVASMASCATKVTSAPTSLTAASDPVMGTDLSFTKAPGSEVTQVYRATGGCSTDVAKFQYVGQTAGSSFTDSRAQGGLRYSYVLRGADGCGEGPAGSCVTITPAGRCDRKPVFAGVTSAVPVANVCWIRLSWGAASTGCANGGSLHYNVYRSEAANPSVPGTWVGSVSGLTFEDTGVTAGKSYLYIVRAEDSNTGGNGPNGGNEDSNTVALMAAASGAPGALGTWSDDGGDGGGTMSGQPPWRITTAEAASGSRSYHAGPDTGTYPSSTCASLTTPPLTLGTGSILSYSVRYNLEWQWDGVVVEISADGGTTWTDLPPTSPSGYPDTLAQSDTPVNACHLASTHGAFTGPTDNAGLTAWTVYRTSISPAYDGRTVQIRWRLTSDSNTEYEGFFLDAISVTNVRVPVPCTAVPNHPPTAQITAPSGSVSTEAGLDVTFAGTGSDPDPFDSVRYRWSFGDGSPDATVAAPPPHPFALPGTYTVTFTVSDFRGGSVSDSRTVTVGPPLVAGTSLFVPVVTDTDGANGSHYVSELTVASHADRPIPVLLAYTAAAGGGTGYARLTLGPGQQRVLPAVIAYLRSRNLPIPSDGSPKIGTLLITFGVTSPGEVFAGTRTYTRDPSGGTGTFGLFYPDSGVSNTSITVFGLQQNDSQRSNLALQNVGALPVTLHSDILGPSGESLGGFDTALPPYGWYQKNQPLAGTGAASGRARITRVAGTSLFAAYGVLNDAVTSDGSFLTPLISRGGPAAERLVPIVVSAGGYSSELTLTNLTAAPLPLNLTYTASSQPGFSPDGSGTAALTLQPGEQRIEPDALAFLRRIGLAVPSGVNAGGALLVAGPPGSTSDDFAVGARTFTAGPAGGSFGLFYAGLSPAETATDLAYVHGLQQDERLRSNLAAVNRGDAGDAIMLRITFYDAGGTPLPNPETRTLQPGEWLQLNHPLGDRGAGEGWARIERLSGRSRFAAYGVLNDMVNSDGSYVPMSVP